MDNDTEVVQSPQENLSVENASSNDLRDLLNQTSPETQEPLQGTSLETEPSETGFSEEANVLPQDQPQVENDEERLAKRRIRPKNDLDQQVIDLYRSDGFQGTFADASSIIYQTPTQQPQQPNAQSEAPAPRDFVKEVDQYVNHVRSEIADLNTKVTEAAENMDTLEAITLQQQIMDRQLKIQKAEGRREQYVDRVKTDADQSRRTRSAESRDTAVAEYPELADDNSVFRKEFDHFVTLAQTDPDYAPIFQSSKWPELLARDFGTMKGQLPTQARPVVQEALQQQNPIGTQGKMLTSGGTNQPINPPSSGVGDISQMSKDQLFNFLGQADGNRHIR